MYWRDYVLIFQQKSVSTINELLATILLHALEIREYGFWDTECLSFFPHFTWNEHTRTELLHLRQHYSVMVLHFFCWFLERYLENKSYRPTHWGRALALVNDRSYAKFEIGTIFFSFVLFWHCFQIFWFVFRFVHESLCVLELLRLGQLHGQPLKTIPSHTSGEWHHFHLKLSCGLRMIIRLKTVLNK